MDIEELKELYDENREIGYVAIIFISIIFGVFIDFALDSYLNERTPRGLATVIISIIGLCLCILAIYTEKAEEAKYNAYTASAELEELEEAKEKASTLQVSLKAEQELSQKQAGELTTTKQALAGAYEKIQVLEKDLAGANKGLSGADELLTRAGKDLAGVKQELAGAKIEINTCKNELAGEKAQGIKRLPYITLAKLYNAYKVSESAFKSANSKSDAEGKGQAKKAFAEAKQALDNQYQKINN